MRLRNIKNGEFGLEGEVYFSLFKKYIGFHAKDTVTIDYVERCADYLNSLNDQVIDALCEASIKYCDDFLKNVGEESMIFMEKRAVLSAIYPNTLIVPDPENDSEPVLHLELNCEWEEEHGMEWIIRNNEVLYVGAFNYENPWGDYSIKHSWNYA